MLIVRKFRATLTFCYTGNYIKLAPSTDQTRTLDIPFLLHRLGLAIQIDLSSTRVSLQVKE